MKRVAKTNLVEKQFPTYVFAKISHRANQITWTDFSCQKKQFQQKSLVTHFFWCYYQQLPTYSVSQIFSNNLSLLACHKLFLIEIPSLLKILFPVT